MMCSNLEVPAIVQRCFLLYVQRHGLQGSLKDEITDPDQLSGLTYWLQFKRDRIIKYQIHVTHPTR